MAWGFFKGTKAKLLPSTGIEFSDGRFYTYGAGSPEGVVTATVGSFYSDTTGGSLYTKNSGTGNTGWVQSNGLSLDIILNSIKASTISGLIIKDETGNIQAQIGVDSAVGRYAQMPRILGGDGVNDAGTIYPNLAFTDDTTTGVYLSNLGQLDLVTDGKSRFRLLSTGQIQAVYESQVGTDYNTTLHNGYLCRAWVNFDGTGAVAIRGSGNVSTISDNGTGDYTVNFTVALPDAEYSANTNGSDDANNHSAPGEIISRLAASLQFQTKYNPTASNQDMPEVHVSVHR